MSLLNLVRVTSATTGTGTLTLGAAVSGFLNVTQAGGSNGKTYSYAIEADYVDGVATNREVGTGVWSSGGNTLTRSVVKSTNGNALLNLAGDAQVIITDLAADHITAMNVQVFEAASGNATYTPSFGMKYVLAIITGGGGGGGGSDTDGSAAAAGGGGEAGGTAIKLWTAAQVGASAAITVAGGGAGGSATNGTAGTDGGDVTVTPAGTGSAITALGGDGGDGSGVTTTDSNITNGGGHETDAQTGGDINLGGGSGGWGLTGHEPSTFTPFAIGGFGGASFWGGGGGSVAWVTGGGGSGGASGTAYGSGGGGAVTVDNLTGNGGGSGKDGVAVFIEFIN
jgi:hypothetical protein